MSEETVDVRGEVCSMPELKVEKFLRSARAPFTVLGDHRPTMESIRDLASRAGWACEIERDEAGNWRARLSPKSFV